MPDGRQEVLISNLILWGAILSVLCGVIALTPRGRRSVARLISGAELLRDALKPLALGPRRRRLERRRTEGARSHLAAIVEGSDDAIIGTSLDGTITTWNSGAERILGWNALDVIGKSVNMLIPREEWSEHTRLVECLSRGESRDQLDAVRLARDGRRVELSVRFSPVRDESGAVVGFSKIGREITAQRQAERDMARFCFDLSAEMLCVADFDGNFVRLNPAWERTLGFTREELLANPFANLVHPEDCANTLEQLKRLASADATGAVFENRYRRRDGTYRWLLWNSIPMPGKGLIYATAHDITERKQAEAALVQTVEETERVNRELSFHKFALDQHAIVAITDRSGRITYVNDKFCEISGYSREELIGQDHRIVNSGFHPKSFFTALYCTIAQGRVWRGEIRNRAKDGQIYWVDTTIVPFADKAGRVVAYVAIRADITERKLAEEALVQNIEESERVNRELSFQKFALDQHAIVAITDRSGCITYVNEKFCEISGYSREELVGQDHRVVNSGFHPKLFFKELYSTIAQGRVWRGEICNRAKDGRIYWVDTTIVPFEDKSGRVMGYVAIRADITERKQAETEIERVHLQLTGQNHRLVALTEQAHRFVDDVSHEFRTPLAVIKEFGAIITDGLAGPITADQGQYLGIIDNAVLDLNQMVEDFLDSSKLRAGRLRVDRRPQLMSDIFARIRPGLQKKAASRSITVVERIDPGLPLVFADEEKVRRVLMNLATNAVKFSPAESRVELWARRAQDGGVEVGVTDQGRGLTTDDLAQLFERFRQLPNADAPSVKGFGLGLNIARQLVWLNLGSMNVVSELGKGSTFSFSLPADDPQMILDRFFLRLAECEDGAPSVGVISVTPDESDETIDALRLFLAAATRPTDVILDMPRPAANALLLIGPTGSAEGWAARLLAVRNRALADTGAAKLGSIRIEVLGVFNYPAGAAEATTCALEHVAQESAVA